MTTISAPRNPPIGKRLAGMVIAISVSDAPDLPQLGFPPDLIPRVLEAVLSPLVAEGARIAYGGSVRSPQSKDQNNALDLHHFTLLISHQLGEAYRRLEQQPSGRPFIHFAEQRAFNRATAEDLVAHLKALAPYGEMRVIGAEGTLATLACISEQEEKISVSAGAGNEKKVYCTGAPGLRSAQLYQAIRALGEPEPADSLTRMREQMAQDCHARVQMGGKKSGYTGKTAGLCEEALLTIKSGKPLLPLGGFGGATRDIAIELGLMDRNERVPRPALSGNGPYEEGLQQIVGVRNEFEAVFTDAEHASLRALARTESISEAGELVARFMLALAAKA